MLNKTIIVQPTPEYDGIELYFKYVGVSESAEALYITKEELPIIIKKLEEMMEYVTK